MKMVGGGIILLFLATNIIPIVSCLTNEKHPPKNDFTEELSITTKTKLRGINVTLIGTKGENGWYIGPVSISVTADNGTQIIDVHYRINGGSWIQLTTPFIITTDGWILLDVKVLD